MTAGKFEQAAQALGKEVDIKNTAYGDSVGKSGDILRILYPNGIQPEQYGDMQLVTRIIDKLFRVATHKLALGESPFRDLGGYGILGMVRDAEKPIGQQVEEYARQHGRPETGFEVMNFGSEAEARDFMARRIESDGYYYLREGDIITGNEEVYHETLGVWQNMVTNSISTGAKYKSEGEPGEVRHLSMRIKL